MTRSLTLPGILAISILASCGPPYPEDRWGPPPPPTWGTYGPRDDERPRGVDALRDEQRRQQDPYYRDQRYGPPDDGRYDHRGPVPGGGQPTPTNPPPTRDAYPVAERTNNPDQVISPYAPYNVIDISGPPRFRSGQLARDPSNQKIFRVP